MKHKCVFLPLQLSGDTGDMNNNVFLMGMQTTDQQHSQKTLWSTIHSLVGRWVGDDNRCCPSGQKIRWLISSFAQVDRQFTFSQSRFPLFKLHNCTGWSFPCHAPYSPCRWETLSFSLSQQAKGGRDKTEVHTQHFWLLLNLGLLLDTMQNDQQLLYVKKQKTNYF